MKWHYYGMSGMWGPMTNPAAYSFAKRVSQLGVDIHASPYRDYDAGHIALEVSKIPDSEGVFLCGTSLGADDVPVVCSYVLRYKDRRTRIDGAFGFQASIYGPKGYPLNKNVKFAHLIYSYNPWPFPGLGMYKWPAGTMDPKNFHLTPHHLPHPGDYDIGDQNMFLREMQSIMKAGTDTHEGRPST